MVVGEYPLNRNGEVLHKEVHDIVWYPIEK